MESAGLYAIGSAVGAVAGSPASSLIFDVLINWFHKKRLAKRVRGLLMMKGVTTLCQKLTSPDCVYIDVDSLQQTLNAPKSAEEANKPSNPVDDILAYSIIKKHIINISSVFKGKIILVSKNYELLKSLPVKLENIYFAVFSRELEGNIGVIFQNEKEHRDAEVQKFRDLQHFVTERIYINDSMKELYENTEKIFCSKKVQL